MARRFTRSQFLARLQSETDEGRPLLMSGAGNGLCAKFIERGGADIIGIYNTGYCRRSGKRRSSSGSTVSIHCAICGAI
jgi:predicted TIM-barrel enzyme